MITTTSTGAMSEIYTVAESVVLPTTVVEPGLGEAADKDLVEVAKVA